MDILNKTELFPITQDLEIHEFPEWGPIYDISFDLKIDNIEKNGLYVSVLTFTANKGQCCNVGDRIPGIYLKTDTENFHIGTQIDDDGNRHMSSIQKYVTNKWYHFQIKQFKIFGKMVID